MFLKCWKISGVECVRTLESNDSQLWTRMSLSSGVELVMVVESNVFGLCARMSFVSGLLWYQMSTKLFRYYIDLTRNKF